jgi:hypothetical protein
MGEIRPVREGRKVLMLRILRPSRRCLRFSLRSALIAMTIAGIWFGYLVSETRRQQGIQETVERAGGWVYWDYEIDRSKSWIGFFPTNPSPPGPYWLRRIAGDNFLARVERVYIQDGTAKDSDLAMLDGATSIRWLSIGGTSKGVTDKGVQHLEGLHSLENLGLSNTGITNDALVHVRRMKGLRKLQLSGTNITDEGLVELYGLKNLELLTLGPHVTPAGIARIREQLPNCKVELYR